MVVVRRRFLALVLAMALAVGACTSADQAAPTATDRPAPAPALVASPAQPPVPAPSEAARPRPSQVGAYYYLWNPENLSQGYLRGHLQPPQPGVMERATGGVAAVEADIAAAATHGIDFFAVNWWPSRPELNRRLDEVYLRASNVGDIGFCLFYETQDLGYQPATGATRLDARKIDRLVADMTDFARRYFDHPSYLRVDGRPVVVLYLTRTLVGDVAGAVARVREALRAEGEEVFLIADEVFWRVAPLARRSLRPVAAPQVDRARLFDALTAYNLYDADRPGLAGYGATSGYLEATKGLYATYRDALGGAVPIVPSVIPGFNDRGVRPRLRHGVIPRQWAPGERYGSFFERGLDEVAIPLLDERLPLLMVTSWNEWIEDTAIQPVATHPPVARDDSRTGDAFTGGASYEGNSTTFLDAIRERFGGGGLTRVGSGARAFR